MSKKCGIIMPRQGPPNFDEIAECMRPREHNYEYGSKICTHHLARLRDGIYYMWYHDDSDDYEDKDDEDFTYYEISEEEASRLAEGVTE